MEGTQDEAPPRLFAEAYEGALVDFVHRESLERIVSGQKPADQSTISTAKVILARIQELKDANVAIRYIDDPSVYTSPKKTYARHVAGGAFDKQCLDEYMKSARGAVAQDPLLTLHLD